MRLVAECEQGEEERGQEQVSKAHTWTGQKRAHQERHQKSKSVMRNAQARRGLGHYEVAAVGVMRPNTRKGECQEHWLGMKDSHRSTGSPSLSQNLAFGIWERPTMHKTSQEVVHVCEALVW